MKIKCIFGHKLGAFRDMTIEPPGSTELNMTNVFLVSLRQIYSGSTANVFYMNASCVNCGMHFSVKKEIPQEIANFLYAQYKSMKATAVESALEHEKSKKKVRKSK